MAELFHDYSLQQRVSWDKHPATGYATEEENLSALKKSTTIYVGNLSFYTKESQILETFSLAGPVKRVIMGINKATKTPCGFCFVEFFEQAHAQAALVYLSDTACDDRIIRCGWDSGFKEGRQYGRGKSGGQVRDEMLRRHDPDRPRVDNAFPHTHSGGRHGQGNSFRGRGRDSGGYAQNNNYRRHSAGGGGGYRGRDRHFDDRDRNRDRERERDRDRGGDRDRDYRRHSYGDGGASRKRNRDDDNNEDDYESRRGRDHSHSHTERQTERQREERAGEQSNDQQQQQ